jgi:hypothetical protein
MPTRSTVQDDYTEDPAPERGTSQIQSMAWSPAQLIAMAIGLFFAILGGVALARTGLDLNDVHQPHEVVGWGDWHHTPLLGLIELGFGVLMLVAAVVPGGSRVLMGLLSVTAVGFGIFVLADAAPARLHNWLGVHDANGWLYVVLGATGIVAGMFSPIMWHRREEIRGHRRRAVVRRDAAYEQ